MLLPLQLQMLTGWMEELDNGGTPPSTLSICKIFSTIHKRFLVMLWHEGCKTLQFMANTCVSPIAIVFPISRPVSRQTRVDNVWGTTYICDVFCPYRVTARMVRWLTVLLRFGSRGYELSVYRMLLYELRCTYLLPLIYL